MGKNKKHKLRKSKENDLGGSESSEEGGGFGCTHINKSTNFAAMRKAIQKQQTFGECTSCCKEAARSKKPEGAGCLSLTEDCLLDTLEPTLWVCLQCGHQGCDRNSRERHAVKHYEIPRSSSHSIVINTTTWTAWCYDCDDEVLVERTKRLQECREFLKKCAGLPIVEQVPGRKNSLTDVASGTDQSCKDTKGRPLTPKSSSGGCQKVKGLCNLGNTCFFNAVMQNLAQTHCLENVLVEKTKKGQGLVLPGKYVLPDSDSSSSGEESDEEACINELPPVDIVLSESGPLTQSMLGFLQEMNSPSIRSSTINPSILFGQVCKKAPRFKGFQQQDSHELLRYLLDVMRTEEIKRSQAGILKHFKLSENINPKKVDEDTKIKIKAYGKEVRRTFMESVFGGQLMSTVVCEECKFISQVFEPFLDLSLPVTEEKPQRPNLVLGGRKKETVISDVNETPSPKGVEGFAFQSTKQPDRKMKRQAKKEAKRKAKQALKSTSSVENTNAENESCKQDYNKESLEGEQHDREDGSAEDKDVEDNDDPSDADIEDNLESDTSRCNRCAILPMELDPTVTENDIGNGHPSSHNKNIHNNEQNSCNIQMASLENGDSYQAQSVTRLSENSSEIHSNVTASDSLDSVVTVVLKDGDPIIEENNLPASSECCLNSDAQTVDSGDKTGEYSLTVTASVDNADPVDVCAKDVQKLSLQMNGYQEELQEQTVENIHEDCKLKKNISLEKNNCLIENSTSSIELNNVKNLQTTSGNRCPSENYMQSEFTISSNSHLNLCRQSSKQHLKNRKEMKKEVQLKSIMMLGPRYQPSSRECSIMSCLHQFTAAELLIGNNKFGCANCSKQKHKQNPHKDKKETVYSSASKQYLIFVPPAVLTLHLKRFEQVGFSSRKVNRHVDFPLLLDLAPYCSSLCQGISPGQKKVLYSLYGVVEHSGRLNAGHYTAYVKVRPNIGMLNNFLQTGELNPMEHLRKYVDKNLYREQDAEGATAEGVEDVIVPPGRWFHISDNRVSEVTETTVQHAQAYLLFYERIY
ncbi:hypothetical protein ScPMuIL_012338 [Solemya velum]